MEESKRKARADGSFSAQDGAMVLSMLGDRMPMQPARYKLAEANDVFERTQDKNLEVYNTMLRVYYDNSHATTAVKYLEMMGSDDVVPSPETFSYMIGAYCMAGEVETASGILKYMQAKNVMVKSSVFSYMAVGHIMKGETTKGFDILNHMYVNDFIIDYETVFNVCFALVRSKQINELKSFVNSEIVPIKDKLFFNSAQLSKLAIEMLKHDLQEHWHLCCRFACNTKFRYMNLLYNTTSHFEHSPSILLQQLHHCSTELMALSDLNHLKNYTYAILNQKTCENLSALEWQEILGRLKMVSVDGPLMDAFDFACKYKPEFCFVTMKFFAAENLKISVQDLCAVSTSSLENEVGLEAFCVENNIEGYAELQEGLSELLDEKLKNSSDLSSLASKALKKYIANTLVKEKGSIRIQMLQKVKDHPRFNEICEEVIVEKLNARHILNDQFINRFLRPQMNELRLGGFTSLFTTTAPHALMRKLKFNHHFALPLLLTTDVEKLTNVVLVRSDNSSGNYEHFQKVLIEKILAGVPVNTLNIDNIFHLDLRKVLLDTQHHPDRAYLTECYRKIKPAQFGTFMGNLVATHYIREGCTEDVVELHQKLNEPRENMDEAQWFDMYYVPVEFLKPESRDALMYHLTAVHGEELAPWIVYLSCLTNSLLEEAALVYEANKLVLPPTSKKLSPVLSSPYHARRLFVSLGHLVTQCKNAENFADFFTAKPSPLQGLKLEREGVELVETVSRVAAEQGCDDEKFKKQIDGLLSTAGGSPLVTRRKFSAKQRTNFDAYLQSSLVRSWRDSEVKDDPERIAEIFKDVLENEHNFLQFIRYLLQEGTASHNQLIMDHLTIYERSFGPLNSAFLHSLLNQNSSFTVVNVEKMAAIFALIQEFAPCTSKSDYIGILLHASEFCRETMLLSDDAEERMRYLQLFEEFYTGRFGFVGTINIRIAEMRHAAIFGNDKVVVDTLKRSTRDTNGNYKKNNTKTRYLVSKDMEKLLSI